MYHKILALYYIWPVSSQTVAIVLRKPEKGKEEGLRTLYIRITVDRKQTYVKTGVRVFAQNWDGKLVVGVAGAEQLNVKIQTLYNQVLQNINRSVMEQQTITARSVKTAFSGVNQHNIFEFADSFKDDVSSKREEGTLVNYEKHLRKLEEYHGSRNLMFKDIDVAYLNSYEKYLRKLKVMHNHKPVPMSNNYVALLLRVIRTMFNAAIKQGVVTETPFSTYEFPAYKAPIKDYLTLKELEKWEKYTDEVTNPSLKQSAVYFLLGCYTGLRISDWLRFDLNEHIKDNGSRILLRAKKNGEWVGMKISVPLRRNLKRMEDILLTMKEQTINEKLKEIAATLGIKKKLTTHSGRHTFAITLCAELGMSVETCAQLMGITVKTCIDNYYRVSRDKIDSSTDAAWADLT